MDWAAVAIGVVAAVMATILGSLVIRGVGLGQLERTFSKWVGKVETSIARLDEMLRGHDERLDRVEMAREELRGTVAETRERLVRLEGRMNGGETGMKRA